MNTWNLYVLLSLILIGLCAGAAFTLVQWVMLYGQTIHV